MFTIYCKIINIMLKTFEYVCRKMMRMAKRKAVMKKIMKKKLRIRMSITKRTRIKK